MLSEKSRTQIEWRYLLEGFDEAWQGPELFTEGGIRYTNVPPGDYRLQVAARWHGQERWGEAVISPAIRLHPPFWKRRAFLAGAGLALIALFVGGPALVAGSMRARARRFEGINRQLAEQMVERAKVEKALRSSEARLATIFAATPDAISLSELKDGTFLEVNRGFTGMSGYEHEEIVGKSSLEIDLWIDPAQREDVARRLADGPIHNVEVIFRTKAGDPVICLLSAGIIEIDERRAVLAVLRDISDRKRADEERERLIRELELRYRELERFAYTLSHDLKTPLFTVQGFLGLLKRDLEGRDTARVHHDLDHIRQAGETMGALLDDLLAFLSIDPRTLDRQAVELSEHVEKVLGEFAERLEQLGAEVHVEPDLPRVTADPRLLGQILRHLMDNALTYLGDQTAPRIEIGARMLDGGHCAFHVRDNGLGIEPRYHTQIFDLFERLEPRTEGTGLGLALARRIVELHGGRIWVESEGLGHGATFYVVLDGAPRDVNVPTVPGHR